MKFLHYLWIILRYLFAAVSSTIVTVAVPFVIASLPFLGALIWVFLWVFAILFSMLPGQPIDLPMDEPIGIVLVPLLLSIFGAVSVSVIVVVTIVFNFVVILPFGVLVEYLNKRLGLCSWIVRLGSYLIGGVFLGFVVGIGGIFLANIVNVDFSPFAQIGMGAFLAVICISGEFIFGTLLVIMDLFRKFLDFLNSKIKNV